MNNKAMIVNSFPDYTEYRLACGCGSKEHDVSIAVEIDEKVPGWGRIEFYVDVDWAKYYQENWMNPLKWVGNILCRLKAASRLAFQGRVELQHEISMTDPEHVESFIYILKECQQKINSGNPNVV
jgi:hypothetical protein